MMIDFAIFDKASGAVLRIGRGTKAALSLAKKRLKVGQGLYRGRIDPATTFLPNGKRTPKPESDRRQVTDIEVKAHAGRLLSYTDWVVVKALDTGEPADPAIIAKRQAIRGASNALEAMDPIPADFTDPKYWP